MSGVRVPRGGRAGLGRIEGELRVGRGARIAGLDGQPVVVAGGAYFEGDARVECNLECASLTVRDGTLRALGGVVVSGRIDVDHHLRADGSVQAKELDVGGSVRAKALSCEKIRAGGDIGVVDGLRAESVQASGKLMVPQLAEIGSLAMAGKTILGGGSISGRAEINGSFIAEGKIRFGDLVVNGHCTLPSGCTGTSISTFGRLHVAGDLECDSVRLMGKALVEGDLKAKVLHVDGKLDVSRSLFVSDAVEAHGSTDISGEFVGMTLVVEGGFRAGKASVGGEADLMGQIGTKSGLRAKRVIIRNGSTCSGPLVGELVEIGKSGNVVSSFHKDWLGQVAAIRLIGKMTQVEDLHGREVHLGSYSKARMISANKVFLEVGSIAGSVKYTDELKVGDRVYLVHPASKVETLSRPPL